MGRLTTGNLIDQTISLFIRFVFPLDDLFYRSVTTRTDAAIVFTGSTTR
jgi:hypothetical protein